MLARPGAHVLWAVLAVLVTLAGPAGAQTASPRVPQPVIIVVDIQGALQQATAGKAARAQRDKLLQQYQAEFDATRKTLKDTENDLVKQRQLLGAEAWQQKARAFEQQVFEFNQRFQRTNQAVEKSFRTAMAELNQALAGVTEEVASEMGANLVLPKSQIFLHDPRMEVTETVVQRLNAKHPSVTFPPLEIEGAAAPKTAPAQPRKK